MPILIATLTALAQGFAAEGGRPWYPSMSPPFHSVVEDSEARAVIVDATPRSLIVCRHFLPTSSSSSTASRRTATSLLHRVQPPD